MAQRGGGTVGGGGSGGGGVGGSGVIIIGGASSGQNSGGSGGSASCGDNCKEGLKWFGVSIACLVGVCACGVCIFMKKHWDIAYRQVVVQQKRELELAKVEVEVAGPLQSDIDIHDLVRFAKRWSLLNRKLVWPGQFWGDGFSRQTDVHAAGPEIALILNGKQHHNWKFDGHGCDKDGVYQMSGTDSTVSIGRTPSMASIVKTYSDGYRVDYSWKNGKRMLYAGGIWTGTWRNQDDALGHFVFRCPHLFLVASQLETKEDLPQQLWCIVLQYVE